MTGFSEIMEVEKALREISIDNCEKIGEGFFGNIYRINEDTIVKVFKVPNSLDLIKKERELSKKAFVLGIPTAIPYDIVKVGDYNGAIFELLNAKSAVELINTEEELDNFAKKSALVLKNMHSTEVTDEEIPSRKEAIIKLLKECEKCFSNEVFEKLESLLNTIPDRNTLLHCDFHVKNIMVQNDELLLIDMDKLSVGHPIFEFGAMYATYCGYSCIDKYNTDKFLGIPLEKATQLFNKTFKYYHSNKSENELAEIIQKVAIISYIQILNLRKNYSEIDTISNTIKEEIDFCINYLSKQAMILETLHYD